jgi:hypothetical protein
MMMMCPEKEVLPPQEAKKETNPSPADLGRDENL